MGGDPLALSAEDRRRIDAVQRLPSATAQDVDALVDHLDAPSWAVRRAVIGAVAAVGDPAVAPLIAALRGRRGSEARLAAIVDALVALRGSPEPALVAAAAGAEPAVRCDVAQVLGRRRHAASAAVLATWVDDADDNVAVAAIEALGRIGGDEGLDALVAAATSGSFFRTFPAIDVLSRSTDPRVLPPLAGLLGDPLCGPEAARALGRRGEADALGPLAELLSGSPRGDAMIRVAAAALVEVAERQRDRFGGDAVAEIVRERVPAADAARRLTSALTGAEAAERAAVARVLGWLGDDAAAAALVGLLADPDVAVASAAAGALGEIGGRAAREVLGAVRDGDSRRRLLLLPTVPLRPDVAPDLTPCLDDPDPDVRVLACDVLARAGATDAVPALFGLLDDDDGRVSQAAVGAIGALGTGQTEALTLAAVTSPNVRVRLAATRILGYFGWASALDPLLAELADPDERVRHAAIAALAHVDGPAAVQALLDVADSAGDPRARAAAARALGWTGGGAAVVASLEARLADPDAWVRYYACQALGRLESAQSLPLLVARLADEAGQVRIAVVDALARLALPEATEALVRAAGSGDPDLRRAALLGLGQAHPEQGLAPLLAAAGSPDPATRVVALSALVAFDGEAVEQTLAQAADDADAIVRGTAFGALAARPGRAATDTLIARLDHPTRGAEAAAALGRHVEGRISAILADIESSAAHAAPLVAALARMDRPDAVAALGVALSVDRPATRRAAAAALVAVGSDVARALLTAAQGDPDPEVRRLAALRRRE